MGMQSGILIAVLLATLIFLHVTKNALIFQRNIRTAKVLAIIVLTMMAGTSSIVLLKEPLLLATYDATMWILLAVAYAKLLSGCYNVAFLEKTAFPDPVLRTKIRSILLNAIDKDWATPEYKKFVTGNYGDPLVEAIRSECEKLNLIRSYLSEKDAEILRGFAEKLKEKSD